jgi:mono/diheme cytochrome c family protein
MNNNKWLLLASSLGVLALLVVAAVQENWLREWRQIQAVARVDDQPVTVQLRQIVNASLPASDRCVSCHVSMASGEQNVTGAPVLVPHRPVVHDPAEYGCTVCHGGQGRATERADAHGQVEFWPEPMLSASRSEAGCGTCHAPVGVPSKAVLNAARATFERLDCLACHRVDGRGGTLRPDGGGMEGPDLSRVGIVGYDRQWHEAHVAKAAAGAPGPWSSSFAAVSDEDQQRLADYLATRVGAPRLVAAKSVFHSAGCLGCHRVDGVGGDEGLELTRSGLKDPNQIDFSSVPGEHTLQNWFAEHVRSPSSIVVGSQMPALGLAEADVEALTLYQLSLRRRDLPGSFVPRDRVSVMRFGAREFSADGPTVFGAFCAGCHGLSGQGHRSPGLAAFPSVANPDFLALASDDFIRQTIVRGRPGRRMPAWATPNGLQPAEIDRVIAYLRQAGRTAFEGDARPPRWVAGDGAIGGRLFAASCAGCHGPTGGGGEGPALDNPVLLEHATDTFLVETIARGRRGTAMAGFLRSSPTHRTLSRSEIESIVTFIRSWQGGQK